MSAEIIQVLASVGGIILAAWGVSWRVNGSIARVREQCAADITSLHARVNRNRDRIQSFKVEVAERYVSNDHLNDVEHRLVKSIDQMREEFREGNRQVLAALSNGKDKPLR